MDGKARRLLRFEALEDRVFLSATLPPWAAATATHSRAAQGHGQALRGTLQIPLPSGGGSERTLDVDAVGTITPLGPVRALGTFTSDPQGSGGGSLALAGGQGGLVLQFEVVSRRGGRGAPQIRFTIVGGNGAFTDASGQGTAALRHGSPTTLNLALSGTIWTG